MNKQRKVLLGVLLTTSTIFTGCGNVKKTVSNKQASSSSTINEQEITSPTLNYLGHSSVKIKTSDGLVIYIDPAFGEDYSEPADIVFITHFHDDHYNLGKISTDKKYELVTPKEALKDGEYQKLDVMGVNVESVPAYNSNHLVTECVGYILEFDGIKLYHAGDTSKIKEMSDLAAKNINYALLPMDVVYNMGPEEATEVATIIKAKKYIPIHTGPDGIFSQENVDKFIVDNKIVLQPGTKIDFKK